MEKRILNAFTKSNKTISLFPGLFLFFIVSMNLSGQKIYTMLDEVWSAGNWQNSSLQTNTYDVSGYMTNSLTQGWVSGAWVNSAQTNYTNNSDGTVNRSVFQIWDGVSTWNDFSRSTNTYNASKKILTTVGETWFVSLWVNSSNKINTYDGSGYLINSLNQTWNGSSWVNSSQTNYTNNPNGSVNSWTSQIWSGSSWNNTQRLTYTYNGSGKILTLVAEQYTAGNWVSQTMITYTYNGSGYLTNELSQLWDSGSTSWKDNSRTTYTNNPDGTANQSVSQSWNGSVWNNTDRITIGYSQPTGISEYLQETGFTIYPNPVYNIVNIKAKQTFDGSTYLFTDLAGKIILKGILTDGTTSVDLQSLASGIYLLHIGEKSQEVYKVIKQ